MRYLLLMALVCCAPAQAALIAIADGLTTSGCNDCSGSGTFDTFGFGGTADLTGQKFRVELGISDARLAIPPMVRSDGSLHWIFPQQPGYLTASITMNGKTHTMSAEWNGLVDPYIEYLASGAFAMHYQHETATAPAGCDPPQYGAWNYDHLSATEFGSAYFRTFDLLRDFHNQSDIYDKQTWFTGSIGGFRILPAANIPEPSTVALMLIGAMGLVVGRRSTRRISR